jgi:hypothetical protein
MSIEPWHDCYFRDTDGDKNQDFAAPSAVSPQLTCSAKLLRNGVQLS